MSAIGLQSSYFRELCAGLSWGAEDLVAMIWGYFDESGYHNHITGHPRFLSFGGCVASCAAWLGFEEDWRTILSREGIECFHMTDFQAWASPFNFMLPSGERDERRHAKLLDDLLRVIANRQMRAFGFTDIILPKRRAIKKAIKSGVIDTILGLSANSMNSDDVISIMFARHKEFSLKSLDNEIGFFDCVNSRIGALATGDPIRFCQLQAADIIAHEVSNMEGNCILTDVLQKLSQLGCPFRFSASSDVP